MMQFVLENFDTIFRNEASLDNLEKMILDLAVRGKLVPQDSKDEPTSELLKKIKAEKERLIAEKVIKKEKPFPPITEEEIPFDIPDSWEWVRLGEIGRWGCGATPSRNNPEFYVHGTIPWLKTGELNDWYIKDSEEKITELALEKTSLRLCKPNDILIAMYGATIGKLGILEIEATTNQACCACSVYKDIDNKYLYIYLMARRDYFKSQGAGGAQPNISKEKIVNTLFPLPPLAEQQRIVEKVDKMKILIGRLKEIYEANEANRLNLKKFILAEIESSSNNKDLLEALELVFNNFNSIVRSKADVKDIRDLVLSLAVKGKLVPQDSKDEPASELLKKIKAEKERLIAEKVIKKEKPLPPITEEEIPFDIPESWEWVRFSDVLDVRDGTHDTPKYFSEGIPLITSKNIYNGFLDFGNIKYISQEDHLKISMRSKVDKDDILYAMIGSIGNPVIVDCEIEFSIKNVALFKYYIKNKINNLSCAFF